ncbi:MAG TPA: FG-GAP-like repeat-containing protein [Vicinamibacteria bacterium]
MTTATRHSFTLLLLALLLVCEAGTAADYYHPKYRVPPSLEGVLRHLEAGHDAFPQEKTAAELAARLEGLAAALRERPGRAPEAVDVLLAPEFKGGRLSPVDEVSLGSSPQLEIFRARALPSEPVLDRAAFGKEVAALVSELDSVRVAELLITGIDVTSGPDPLVRTTVRFDLAGAARTGGRADRVGHWQMRWRRGADGAWRVVEWTALDHLRSRASAPVFTDVTQTALGGNASFRRQLLPGLDYWAAHLDAVFMPRGMGHHGVSVGDFDGDGLDDVYVSQPEGLPNRLFRNKGDGTFEDVTEAAGVAVLDRTSESLFADVDNDGDQDLILLTQSGPLLFLNDGKGHFTRDPDAFQLKKPLQGSLTSAAMADYDRDGFLDLYLCTYGYFIGVSEDKAGPPSPYHDAHNGSPKVLLRNDGHGRFVDVTEEVGLDQNNDGFSFAAAWADYDEDGWPDLLVANDFGRKNLYHNDGLVDGKIRFRDVAAAAGVEDYGAGMSAAFVDYDNDGHLDIYTGNMWTAAGQRVTAEPGFKPDAPPEIREIYRRHVRGNSLFRNRGDGTFEDVTLAAGAEFGRWAWSSDAFDFDGDGWEDLYVVNGMFTRAPDEPSVDVDSFFWRQVVASSPLTRKPGTSYDDGWRATNRLLVSNGAQAQHERNVLLRNNGHGGFDEVSGSVGLDVDQDGRAFAAFDYDGDGDLDVVLMAPRSSPQLRLFRNDFAGGNAALALRLVGTKSNRDAVGARLTVETDQLRRTKIVQIGSGFLSQGSKELLFGLGKSQKVAKVTVVWPSGLTQTLTGLPLDHRVWIEEGKGTVRTEPFRKRSAPAASDAAVKSGDLVGLPSAGTWLYQPFPAPDFSRKDLDGQEHSRSGLAGHPAVVLFWASSSAASRQALEELARGRAALAAAGASVLTLAVDAPEDEAKVRAAARGVGLPVLIAGEEVASTYSILNRYLFDRREDLRLPTAFLVNGQGEIVKVYHEGIGAAPIAQDVSKIDAAPPERLARAVPFAGTFYSSPAERNYFQYGLELSEQGSDGPALGVFERVARLDPSAITFYNLGTLYMKRGQPVVAKGAFERALEMKPDYADASNSLGALLAQSGDVPGAIERFRAALQGRPDFPDALNNLGFALFQTGQPDEAYALYEKALKLQPEFPEALNNLGIFFGRRGDLETAQRYFQQAVDKRPGYGEAGNNLALVLAARGDAAGAVTVLQRLLQAEPAFEMTYVTLARIYLKAGQRREGIQVLERLLQRNPSHPLGLELLRQAQAAG